ncbi:MAG TPA: LapA family protein [Burkholderiales bacterium]|nr:LapA family protein [Burkholderiales bacterium]
MRYLLWILKFVLFALVLAFALMNTELVTVRYYFGGEWQSPLIFVLLVAFCAGVALGLAAALSSLFRQRSEIALLKDKLRQSDPAGAGSASALIRG